MAIYDPGSPRYLLALKDEGLRYRDWWGKKSARDVRGAKGRGAGLFEESGMLGVQGVLKNPTAAYSNPRSSSYYRLQGGKA